MKVVYTIGTQGMHDAPFLQLLREHQVDAVIDVRLRNEGRYYRFASGKHIRALVEQDGIAYRHELAFAPTSAMRKVYEVYGDWAAYELTYDCLKDEREMGTLWGEEYSRFTNPCLLCAEELPDRCHRRLLAEHLGKVFDVPILHLGKKVKP